MKEGKKRSVIFAHAKHEDDPGIARNFKVTEFPALVYVQSEKTDGWADDAHKLFATLYTLVHELNEMNLTREHVCRKQSQLRMLPHSEQSLR